MQLFLLGVAGAFVAYFALYRESRFAEFFKDPRKRWNTLLFDMLFFLAAGGMVAKFLADPKNSKEAFMAGVSWQGIVGGVLAGNELRIAKTVKRVPQKQQRQG
jgi:hypothetical protein